MIVSAVLLLVAYLLGSIPCGLLLAVSFCGVDPRRDGSRSTGATNVARLCGFGWGVLTLACDILKGCAAVGLALWMDGSALAVSLAAFACLLGHVFSCFLGFRGGKAVATSIGVFLPLAFWPLLAACVLCLVVIWVKRFTSLGSLTLAASLPLFLLIGGYWRWLPLSLCIFVLVLWTHRENIGRLLMGKEKPFLRTGR